MSTTFDSSVSAQINAASVPFIIVGDQSANVAVSDKQRLGVDNGQNDFPVLRYLLGQCRMKLHDIVAQNEFGTEDQTSSPVARPFIYKSTFSRQRSLRVIMYRPQELMTNALLNFVGFVSQMHVDMSVELEQELLRLDAILVEELTLVPGLLSYASLRTSSGTWYNLVLMNDDQVRSNLKQGIHHQYAAYQLAPQCYKWIRIHSGTLPGGVQERRFEVQRTKAYAPYHTHSTGLTFCVHENTYARDVHATR